MGAGGINNKSIDFEKYQQSFANQWKQCFEQNQTLLHVDISHNGFTNNEIDIMADGLKSNHTILGIHMGGNDAEVDA